LVIELGETGDSSAVFNAQQGGGAIEWLLASGLASSGAALASSGLG
jgi:hypothetical protein